MTSPFFCVCNIISGAEYTIKTTWNNQTTSHPNKLVTVQLDKQDAESFKVTVNAPFFGDPHDSPPDHPTPAGDSLFGLWDFESMKSLIHLFKKKCESNYFIFFFSQSLKCFWRIMIINTWKSNWGREYFFFTYPHTCHQELNGELLIHVGGATILSYC